MIGSGWIGVDLDGTIAEHDGVWRGPDAIGAPIPAMVERVKAWLAEGREVRIFTARVSGADKTECCRCRRAIAAWCKQHIGQELRITCVKDYHCFQIWDDRAVQVVPNTGRRADGAESRSICPKCSGGGIASNDAGEEYTCRRCLGHGRISGRELEAWPGELARLRREAAAACGITMARYDLDSEDALEPPYVCPGCHAVGGERCAPGCIDAEIEAEREDEYERGSYEPDSEDGE